VSFHPNWQLFGRLNTWTYSEANPTITTGTTSASSLAGGIDLPAESMVILETNNP
jgi:hypothetical protein